MVDGGGEKGVFCAEERQAVERGTCMGASSITNTENIDKKSRSTPKVVDRLPAKASGQHRVRLDVGWRGQLGVWMGDAAHRGRVK